MKSSEWTHYTNFTGSNYSFVSYAVISLLLVKKKKKAFKNKTKSKQTSKSTEQDSTQNEKLNQDKQKYLGTLGEKKRKKRKG